MVAKASDLLNVAEVAAELRVSYWTAQRLCALGRIRATNIGTGKIKKVWRVRRQDLEAFAGLPPQPSSALPSDVLSIA